MGNARRIAVRIASDPLGEATAIVQEFVDNADRGRFDSPPTVERAKAFLRGDDPVTGDADVAEAADALEGQWSQSPVEPGNRRD